MMIKRRYVSNEEVKTLLANIVRDATIQNFKPAAIVAPSRGGLGIGTMLSHYYDVPLFPIELSTRDHADSYPRSKTLIMNSLSRASMQGAIMFIDDINDTGRTLGELMSIIQTMQADDINLEDIRYAVLLEKYSSQHEFNFVGDYISEDEDDTWVVFPWEDWWSQRSY
jgi:hypoxanthine phosphoribosyltransferase